MGPQLLDVVKFQERCDPFLSNPWNLDCPVTENDVEVAINNNNFLRPLSNDIVPYSITSPNHIARIAWFVISGWDDPIEVDVGVPSLGCNPEWPLEDGNHRFAAAIIRCDVSILANISGVISEIQTLLLDGS